MKKIVYYIIFFQCVLNLKAQVTFQKTYNVTPQKFEGPSSFQQTQDSGFIIAGVANGGPITIDFFLLRINSTGDTLWSKIYDEQGSEQVYSVDETYDNGIIVCGESNNTNYPGPFILKTDSLGNVIWTKNLTNCRNLNWIEQTLDSGFIATGINDSVPHDLLFVKGDSQGNIIWSRVVETFINAWTPMIHQTSDLGFIFISETNVFSHNLVKLDQFGNLVWSKRITRSTPINPINFPQSLQETSDRGFIIGTNLWTSPSTADYVIIKTDSAGDVLWSRCYNNGYTNNIGSVIQNTDGGFLITGINMDSMSSDRQLFLVKTDSVGNPIWSKTYGGLDNESFGPPGHMYSIQTLDYGIATILTTNSFGPNTEDRIYFVKSDIYGMSGCFEFQPSPIFYVIQVIDSNEILNYVPFTTTTSNGIFNVVSGVNEMSSLCFYDIISDQHEKNSLFIFPNPSTSSITIEIENENIRLINVLNQLGECIYTSKPLNNKKHIINFEGYQAGIYLIQIQTDSGLVSKKFVKQ